MAWLSNLPWLVAQAAPAQAPAAEGGGTNTLNLILAVVVTAGSFILGSFLANQLRMRDYGFKIGLILFTLFASLAVCFMGWPPKRGIDLSGGVVLIYEIDKGLSQPGAMQEALGKINEAVNAGDGEKLDVKPISSDQVEITVPEGVSEARVDQALEKLKKGELDLQRAGRRTENGSTVLVFTLNQRQQKTVDMNKLIEAVNRRINPSGVKELTIRQYGAGQLEVIIPEIDEREVDQIKRRISTSGMLEFRIVANQHDDKELIKLALKSLNREVYVAGKLEGRWVKAGDDFDVRDSISRETKGRGREVLVRIDPYDVGGKHLDRANPDNSEGKKAVGFSFDAAGAEKFGELTRHNLPDPTIKLWRRLGIILDDTVISAPNINDTIRGHGIITGDFTDEYVAFLVGVLNAGSLPASLRPEPISQQRISSQLGDDTIQKGTTSIAISTAAILIFMLVYYRFCGFVADVAVVLNMLVTVALMILIKAAFTLPGLAGLVLTVGMAVDANVLIYERMREETERGASLRMAIRNGFGRAMATIIDSHVTTLVSAAVLYVVGTDQIKGFAVTLIIGLLMSLFTAVFVARVIFDVAEKQRWLTKLNLMHLIGHTNIDFIRWRGAAIAASVGIMLIGFVATWARGKGILDIDFTGGSSVQIVFAEPHDIADVRQKVEDEFKDVAVSSVGEKGQEFKIDTSEKDTKMVQKFLQDTFGKQLETYSMGYGELSTIEKAAEPATTPGNVEAAPAAGEKPASDNKPAEATPPAAAPEKPADDKPATESPATPEPAQPASENPAAPADAPRQSRLNPRIAAPLELAAVGNEAALSAILLAQDQPAEKAATPPATETPAAETPAAETPATETPATDDKPADTSSTPEAASTPDFAGPGDGTMVGGTRATLTFPQGQEIGYVALNELIQKDLAELKFEGVVFHLSNPNYQAGSDARYDEWTLETTLKQEQTRQLLAAVEQNLAGTPVFPSSNFIGGKVAGDTQLMALYAMLASMAIIVIYIWIRFQNVVFGLAAVLALVHDVFVTTGFLALSYYLAPYFGWMLVDPFKISLAVLAALLTIVGFSINDTIVVFDRIREVRGKSPELTEDMINLSVNATLSRTLLTSGTVLIASVILYFLGGPGIHAFAFSMVIGVIAGTFSSIYIAAPVLLWLKKPLDKAQKPGGMQTTGAGKK